MATDEARPTDHRVKTIRSAAHIMEFSKADSHEKINQALNCLYPEDMASIEKVILQTLTTLNQKI